MPTVPYAWFGGCYGLVRSNHVAIPTRFEIFVLDGAESRELLKGLQERIIASHRAQLKRTQGLPTKGK